MRILFLSQLVPYPLDAGPKVRSYYVLRHMAEAGHAVTLLAFSRESDTQESLNHIRSFCSSVYTIPMTRSRIRDVRHLIRSLFYGTPFLIDRDHVAVMFAKVRELAATGEFDVVHADQLWMAPYALAAGEAFGATGPRLVLDQHNAVYLIPQRLAENSGNQVRRMILRREAKTMRRYELETCRRFDVVVWVTAEDRAAVGLADGPGGTTNHVIPICVDPSNTTIVPRVERPHRVTFLGGLHWPPNAAGIVWFAREVWPRVRASCPGAVLTVIGKSPPSELTTRDGIDVTGYVDDPDPFLRETAVFIVPLHAGGGMRVKILDAWAWGMPVVSTTIGAEGIDYRAGENLLIADEPDQMAAAVVDILTRPELGRVLAAGGRKAVEINYDWRQTYLTWDDIYLSPAGYQAVCRHSDLTVIRHPNKESAITNLL